MVITAGQERYVVPLGQVFEMATVPKEEVSQFTNGGKFFKLRGEVIPLFNINEKLGKPLLDKQNLIAVLLKGPKYTFGVTVDDVINQQQIVVKKLGDEILNKKGIMGSAIMGNGRPAVILDVLEIFKDDLKPNHEYQKLFSRNEAVA